MHVFYIAQNAQEIKSRGLPDHFVFDFQQLI